MVNRILIRIKVVQIIYSYYLKGANDMSNAEKELLFSLDKTYELYHYLLLLIIELTDTQTARLEMAKSKHLATKEEKDPNIRFINNRFIAQLKTCKAFDDYLAQQKISWINEQDFLRLLLDKIESSDIYADYMASDDDSYEADKEFWRKVFKQIITENEDLRELLESQSLYWNDDFDIISTFVLKTIKKFEAKNGAKQTLLPMFKDNEDADFAKRLFRRAILDAEVNKQLINEHSKNWELDRVAQMDIIIMSVALAEIKTFPSIPIKVTLNEYIEIAKSYSTLKSGHFINGILDSAVAQLKKSGELTKE